MTISDYHALPLAIRQDGKLRLLYEGAPMSFIMEQAGGKVRQGPWDNDGGLHLVE